MLLDTEATITNSPDASPPQVPNVINENKIFMIENKEHTQRYQITSPEQISKLTLRSLNNLSKLLPTNTIPNKIFNNMFEMKNTNFKVQKLKTKGFPLQSYNPYADENDSNNKFQLSKSFNDSSILTRANTKTLSKPRLFGNDRTNLMQISSRPYSVNNLRREHFHTFNISNNKILNSSSTSGTFNFNQNSDLEQENTVMFRNYDLNDEYWFNFE